MAAPDEEAAPAISLTVRDVTGETTVHENVRPAETDVETFRAAVAAARGTEPALLRLVRGDVPLDDGLRTMAKYGIVSDAELELVAQTAEEGKARRIAAFRDTLSAGAAAWIADHAKKGARLFVVEGRSQYGTFADSFVRVLQSTLPAKQARPA